MDTNGEQPTSELERTILMLTALSDDRYAEALADNVMDPMEVETEAFRSPQLVVRSEAACLYLLRNQIAHVEERLVGDDAETRRRRSATRHFISKVQRERALLQTIINESNARKGIARNASNPRRRALERLATESMKGDVPKGRFRELYDEEKQKDVDARRAARKASKSRGRGGNRPR